MVLAFYFTKNDGLLQKVSETTYFLFVTPIF
jgi:hypothetical protein